MGKGVHNFESQGSGYFYGTVKDVHLAILTAVTATPLQVHVSLLELGTWYMSIRCAVYSCTQPSTSVPCGSSRYTSLSLVPSSWG